MNKSDEREEFNDSVRVEVAELKDTFLFEIFTAFCVPSV